MQQVQLISITLEELQNTIINSVKNQLQEFKTILPTKRTYGIFNTSRSI